MTWTISSENGFTPHSILKVFLIAAIILSALMALASDFNRHPDEVHHLAAAEYYTKHFFPPEIGDPAVRESYSGFGISYLNYHWAEYVFAGKFILLISPVVQNPLMAARFFSVFLFSIVGIWFAYRSKNDNREFIIPCFLLITPQIWYIFAYVNNDAFALFISLVAAYQLAYPSSLLNKFLETDAFRTKFSGGVWFGVLAGLLLIAKPNYWTFLIFAAFWLLLRFPFNGLILKKLAFIFLIAVAILTFRVGLDLYVNGETNFAGISYIGKFFGKLETSGKLRAYQEEIAEYACKPSTLENDLMNSHKDLKLRDKGLSLTGLFTEREWHKSSFNSFVGVYGNMSIWASGRYYAPMLILYVAFGFYAAFCVILSKNPKSIKQLVITVLGCFLTVLISVIFSWIYAFQSQGRYLFPVIPMAGLFVYANRRNFNNVVVHAFLILAFLLSFYSFVFVGLGRINSM
jgi:MFS family permease